jgi:uncharacterized OB-fold protein
MNQPPVDTITQPWWDATRERRLLLQRCSSCHQAQHYPRSFCRSCGAVGHLEWVESTGTATVDAYTVVHRSPDPAVEVPYVVARVRLAEGPILLTNLQMNLADTPADDALFDAPLELAWRPLEDGRHLPVFAVRASARDSSAAITDNPGRHRHGTSTGTTENGS